MKAFSLLAVLLILTAFVTTSFTGKDQKEELCVYYYYNFEDADRGSLVIVLATNRESAIFMIKDELDEYGFNFEPSNIISVVPIKEISNFVIYSDSGEME
jgi:hypothetical protein